MGLCARADILENFELISGKIKKGGSMRIIVSGVFALLILVLAAYADAANVFSANGFRCTGSPTKSGTLVDCDGAFPGVNGIFGGTGYELSHIEYSPDNKNRFLYMSDTGCLVMTTADNASVAVDRTNNKNKFNAITDAMQWCYTGAQKTPSGPQNK